MRFMVATSRTQGQRDNDYFWCVEGRLRAKPALHPDGTALERRLYDVRNRWWAMR